MSFRAVLVGAGHAHLAVVQRAQQLRRAGVDLTLISPRAFRYSGMASGVLSGALDADDGELDVAAFAKAFGVGYCETKLVSADPTQRRLSLSNGECLGFDAVSFNVGSEVDDRRGLLAQPGVWPVKPLPRLLQLKALIEAALRDGGSCPRIVVAGAGPTGLEIAAALAGLCERHAAWPQVTVVGQVDAGAWAPRRAIQQLIAELEDREIVVTMGEVVARGRDTCSLSTGKTLPCDALVLATGLAAPVLTGRLGLLVDPQGRLRTTPRLNAVGADRVFAVGDCAVMEDEPRPCMGVFGVRAGPILAHNLAAMAEGRPLKAFVPQKRWLSILDLGDGSGLAVRGRHWWLGPAALAVKRRLDCGFMRRLQAAAARSDEMLQY